MRHLSIVLFAMCVVACSHVTSSQQTQSVKVPLHDGSVIDTHVHVSFSAQPAGLEQQMTPDKVLSLLADKRLHRLAVIVIAPRDDIEGTRKQNDQLFALVKQHPQLVAVPSVHPLDGEAALTEMARVKGLGAKMLKIHQNTQGFDLADPAVDALFKKAAELDLPVLFEGTFTLDPRTVAKVVELAMKHPKTKMVMAHMGAADFRQVSVIAILGKYPWFPRNIYFDMSASCVFADSPDAPMFAWTIRQVASIGSFWFRLSNRSPAESLDAFQKLGFSPKEAAILKGTAALDGSAHGRLMVIFFASTRTCHRLRIVKFGVAGYECMKFGP